MISGSIEYLKNSSFLHCSSSSPCRTDHPHCQSLPNQLSLNFFSSDFSFLFSLQNRNNATKSQEQVLPHLFLLWDQEHFSRDLSGSSGSVRNIYIYFFFNLSVPAVLVLDAWLSIYAIPFSTQAQIALIDDLWNIFFNRRAMVQASSSCYLTV